MIKAVLIDIDNTLLDFNESAKMAAKLAFEKYELPYNESVHPAFLKINNQFWDKIQTGEITREYLHAERWNTILNVLGIEFDGRKIEKDFLDNLNFCATPIEGALDILEYLSKKYLVCTASNAPHEQQLKRMKCSGIDKFVQKTFISEALGATKPDIAFFEACLKGIAPITKDQTIMIGDSISADIEGAKRCGLKTVWFNFNKTDYNQGVADYVIHNLSEIKNIL